MPVPDFRGLTNSIAGSTTITLNKDSYAPPPSVLYKINASRERAITDTISIVDYMALCMAISRPPGQRSGHTDSLEVLRRRNEELEKELKESREREERVRGDVERMKERLRAIEEAEERLCFQLGEVEAESFEQARAYQKEITSLKQQLSHACPAL